MLVMHVTLLTRHKSSFSYLPHLLTGSAITSTHTVSPHLLLFHLLQNRERETETCNLFVTCICLFQGKMLWETFQGILGTEVLQFLLPLRKPFWGVVV